MSNRISENKSGSAALGHLLAVITICIWGTTFISSQVLLRAFSPVEIIVFRYALAFVVLWLAHPKKLGLREKKHEIMFAVAGLFSVSLYGPLENFALTSASASLVCVVVSTAPFFTALLAAVFIKSEKLTAAFFIGFAVAISGVALISFNGVFELDASVYGIVCALGSALSWAVYSVILKNINGLGYHPVAVVRRVFFWGLVFTIPYFFFTDIEWPFARLSDPVNLLNILFLALVASATCFVLWGMAVKNLGAVKSGAYIYVIPVVTVLTSFIVFGEKPSAVQLLGMALTVLGLLISDGVFTKKRGTCANG